jgi:fructose 1,6-bisphosphatase
MKEYHQWPTNTTLSIYADVGGLVGHVSSHPEVVDNARTPERGQDKGPSPDYHVLRCGDDLELLYP